MGEERWGLEAGEDWERSPWGRKGDKEERQAQRMAGWRLKGGGRAPDGKEEQQAQEAERRLEGVEKVEKVPGGEEEQEA